MEIRYIGLSGIIYFQSNMLLRFVYIIKVLKIIRWCFLSKMTQYFFIISIDGTPTDRIGRFINDSRSGFNAKMVVIAWGGRPHLCLFATKEGIPKGTEVRYCYGVIKGASWRKQVRSSMR